MFCWYSHKLQTFHHSPLVSCVLDIHHAAAVATGATGITGITPRPRVVQKSMSSTQWLMVDENSMVDLFDLYQYTLW